MELLQTKQKELQDHLVESIRLANELYIGTQDKKYRGIKRGIIKNTLPTVNRKFAGSIKGLIMGTQIELLDDMYERFKGGFISNGETEIKPSGAPVRGSTNGGFGTKPPKSSFVPRYEKKNVGLAEDEFLKDLEARRAAIFDDVSKKPSKKEPATHVPESIAKQGNWGDIDVDENGKEIPYKRKEENAEPPKEVKDALDKGEKDGAIQEVNEGGLIQEIALMSVNDFHTKYGKINKQIAEKLGIEEPKSHYKQLAAQIIQVAKSKLEEK